MWQASSVAFLCQHQFDFNKMTYEGVSFLNKPQEEILEDHLNSGVLQDGVDRAVDERVLQRCCSLVAEWQVTAEEGEPFTLTHCDFESVPPYIVVKEMRSRFDAVWATQHDARTVVLQLVSREKKASLEDTTGREERDRILNEHLGFTRVFRELVRHKKPLVGHNCLMDLLLMYEKFHEPLPNSFVKFKRSLLELFPLVYDTKHLCSHLRPLFRDEGFFGDTSLSGLFVSLQSEKAKFYYLYSSSVCHDVGFSRYKDVHCPHEAGYDAFMAGVVFLRMAHMFTMHGWNKSRTRPVRFYEYETKLESSLNAVNIIRASINFVRLDGPDPESQRQEMLFVRSKTYKPLRMGQLAKLFSAYGSVDIKIQHTSEAMVATGNYRCARDILKAFRQHESLYVAKYSMWKHSRIVNRLLWAGLLISGSVCVWGLWGGFKVNK